MHTRPDIATRVAYLQKSIPKATVETLLEGNRTLREAQKFSDTSIIVRSIPLSEVSFASFGDASFASARQLSAQQGLFIMACSPRLALNETTEFFPNSLAFKADRPSGQVDAERRSVRNVQFLGQADLDPLHVGIHKRSQLQMVSARGISESRTSRSHDHGL